MKRAIIIGASSGIGRELALLLSKEGYDLGLAARRIDLLVKLQGALPGRCFIRELDITADENVISGVMNELFDALGGADLVIVSSGTGHINMELVWRKEQNTIMTNVLGVTAVIGAAIRRFRQQGSGHLAAISSVAALRGGRDAPAYSASKAYLSNYLEGLRGMMRHESLPVVITDIRPGFVNTAMAQGEGLFWVARPDKAARQIYRALRARKRVVYITRRWRLIAFLLRIMPGWLYERF